jgi:DNA uptake protein ComE-like DNA-binding protein
MIRPGRPDTPSPSLTGTLLRATVALVISLAVSLQSGWAQVGKGRVLDPNVASEAQIAGLPGMNAALAQEIMDRRPLLSITELDALLGEQLSQEQRTELYRRLFVHINLNTASREEILLVPGVGPRMAREFEEYRPYTGGLPQFRREIGKYVDAAELARLEQYVFVPINLNTATDEDILSIPGLGPRMLREFKEYRPYRSMDQFRREIGKYVSDKEVARLERYVTIQ